MAQRAQPGVCGSQNLAPNGVNSPGSWSTHLVSFFTGHPYLLFKDKDREETVKTAMPVSDSQFMLLGGRLGWCDCWMCALCCAVGDAVLYGPIFAHVGL